MRIIGGGNAVKKILIIIGLMLGMGVGVGVLTGKTVKAAACKSYFTNIFGYSVREWCTPPSEDKGKRCDFNEKSCSKRSGSDESVYKFTCLGHSKRGEISECGNGMSGAVPNTGETMSVGDPGCGKTIQIDVYNKECWVAGKWECDGKSVAAGGNMLDFFVYYNDDCPAPACNTDDVEMEVSPNPVEADSPVSFIIGGDASLYIGDNYGGGASGCSKSDPWYNKTCTSSKTAKTYTWTHTWKLCRFDDPSRCSPKCENSVEYEVVSPRVLSPKSCSVSVGATFSMGLPIAISASGRGNMETGKSEPVRLSLERADGKAINPLPAEVGGSYVSPTGNIYYGMGECLSTDKQLCTLSKNISGGLSPGAYFVHCDLPTDLVPTPPVGLGSKCSGNPFCQLKPTPPQAVGDARAKVIGREVCDKWVSCNVNREDRDYFTVAEPKPVGVGITIRNSGDIIVPVETEYRNQICQTTFRSGSPLLHDRRVKFSVTVSDASGGETINKVSLRLTRGAAVKMQVNGVGLTTETPTYTVTMGGVSLYEPVAAPIVSGNRVTVTFPVQFPTAFAGLAGDSLQIWAEDETGQKLDWTNGGREFKVWDCKVPVEGTVYDGSAEAPVCSTGDGFSTAVEEAGVFTALTYENATANKVMTVSPPASYSSGSNQLVWGGGDYTPVFNGEVGLPGSGLIVRVVDTNKVGPPDCPLAVVKSTFIDAYQDKPEATVDFSFTANQEPWYQTVSGGILSAQPIYSMVPPTCQLPCINALSIDSVTAGTNGLVAADGLIRNETGCSACTAGNPNDWYKKSKNITDGSITYEGLKTLYYDRKGIGKVVSGGNWSSVKSNAGANEVIFVNSDLTINADNSVSTGDFLMVVVNGSVTFNVPTVNRFDGIIVADGAVKAIGEDTETLNLNGSIYARGEFVNGRSLGSGDENNKAPSVKVNYRPDFIFSMPAKLAENVYNWREGN